MSKPLPSNIKPFLKSAATLVKENFKQWMVFTQVVSLCSMGAFLLQDVIMRLTGGSGFFLAAMLLWPLYASLYGAALNLLNKQFIFSDIFLGFSSLWRVLGLTLLHNLVSFLVFFPFYMMIATFLFSELGWSPEQFQSLDAYKPEHIEALIAKLKEVWPTILFMTLPAIPFQVYIQSRVFLAYYYIVQQQQKVFESIKMSLQKTAGFQIRRYFLIAVSELAFPVFFPLFFISYPFKYAILALLIKETEGFEEQEFQIKPTIAPSKIRNPYL